MGSTSSTSFQPTQPLPDNQVRLARQGLRSLFATRTRPYAPNHVPLGGRVLYGLIGLTWTTWALIGVLSGHMFFLVSRKGPVHFAGIPALIFCCAVLAGAAALATSIVDHYDKRDNEETYKTIRRLFWWSALALFVAAIAGGCSPLASSGQSTALLTPKRLVGLLSSSWLDRQLRPMQDTIGWGMAISGAGCVANLGLAKLLGVDLQVASRRSVFMWANALFLLSFVLFFTLMTLRSLVVAEFKASDGEALSAQVAWMHSMLLGSGAVLLVFLALLVLGLCRWLGLISDRSDQP